MSNFRKLVQVSVPTYAALLYYISNTFLCLSFVQDIGGYALQFQLLYRCITIYVHFLLDNSFLSQTILTILTDPKITVLGCAHNSLMKRTFIISHS